MSKLRVVLTFVLITGAFFGCKTPMPSDKVPTQVVYRFDDHRYLTLTGHECEGALFYVDEKRGLNTEVISQFARVFLPDITHADDDGDYVFIPFSDVSAFRVSRDGGRTFSTARWVGTRPWVEEITKLTVINQQAFIETKDGRLFMTSKPFGKGWGMGVIDIHNELPNTILAERLEYQGLPTKVPEVKNYKGWTQMRCDPNL